MIVGAISAFNEEGRIGQAVASLLEGGCGRVLVLDGAWLDDAGVPFGGEAYWSTDATVEEARAAGAEIQYWSGGPDAAKQTQLVRRAGMLGGEFVVKIDADELLVNELPEIERHSMIWLHNHGANDIPEVRSTWPRGDDAGVPIPLFRVFKPSTDLVCVRPGRWVTDAGPLEPYVVGQLRHLVDTLGLRFNHPLAAYYRQLRDSEHVTEPYDVAAFPILNYVRIDHFRHGARASEKAAYYEAVA
jgi:glycosyltransferase involved in cell wall biosynthesis